MNSKYTKLFEPITIGKLTIKNRTSMAPMGLVCYADDNGGFNEEAQDYYIERAKGGVGLLITGICPVNYNEVPDNAAPCPTANPMMFNKSTAPMIEKIHAYDAKIFLQLTGGLGRSAMPNFIKKAYAPSENSNRFDPRITHSEMTIEEIKGLIGDFIKGAAVAKQCGFDGVEIHAVHEGYLLDQFAIALFNRRTDEFGGDLRGRLKIATDIVKGIKSVCGADFPVSLRYSVKSFMKGLRQGALPGEEFTEVGKDYEEGIEAAKILAEAGYDILNVDAGTYDSWYWNHPPMYFEKGMYREFGRMVKNAVNVPVILSGRMDDPDIAIEALNGCCDIVSYGRPLLADPFLVEKIQTNHLEDIRPCLSCHDGCMGRIAHGLPLSCAVNPACGRETKYGLSPAMTKKKILVVGGGVAGLESARVCAIRGHEVTLVEASGKLGGNIIPGSVPDFKEDDRNLIRWYEVQLQKLGVTVHLNTKADRAFVVGFGADVVIAATGSNPIIPSFGKENHIANATDVLSGKESVQGDVVIIGGGLVGCETALWLAQQGKKVSVIEMMPDILGGPHGMPFMNYDMLKDLLVYNKINVMRGTKVTCVGSSSVTVENKDGVKEVPAGTVIVSVGFSSEKSLQNELLDLDIPVYNVGDSRNVKNIMHAVWDAYELARGL
ncbi:FAD-dependent oxidoreductase [Oscillospiraceae bacterium PP1C4]